MNPQTPPTGVREKIIARRGGEGAKFHNIEDIVYTPRIKIPDTIVILGSGPNGRAAWSKIPADAYVIAINEGVNICIDHPSECKFTPIMWIINDRNVLENQYFTKANQTFKGIRAFGDIVLQLICARFPFTQGHIDAMREDRVFRINRGPFHKWTDGPWKHDPLLFIPGGTVCSAALWVGHIKGPAKRVYLCGIDMSKDLHYGDEREPEHKDHRHGEVWKSREHLDKVLAHFASLGVKHYTLSETKLQNVEFVDNIE